MKKTFSILIALLLSTYAFSLHILIPMDETQKNHLKAYGVTYWVLSQNAEVSWLLNYRGGAFLIKHDDNIERQCKLRGVTYNNIADVQAAQRVHGRVP